MTTTQTTLDRDLLLIGAQYLAARARRARLVGTLAEIRQVGQQLAALDPESPAAPDVMNAAAAILDRTADILELIGA